MGNVKVILKKSKGKENLYPLYAQYIYKEQTFRDKTGVKVHLSRWNAKKEFIVGDDEQTNKDNAIIQEKKGRLQNAVNDLLYLNKEPTIEAVRAKYEGTVTLTKGNLLWDYWDDFINEKKKTKNFGFGTQQRYADLKISIEKLEKYIKKDITFNMIVKNFDLTLQKYYNEHMKNKLSYVMTIKKNLTCYLNWCYNKGILKNTEFRDWELSSRHYQKNATLDNFPTITDEEFEAFKKLTFTRQQFMLEKTRDIFLLGCVTGLRFGDLTNIQKTNVYGGFINVVIRKTKLTRQINIPVTSVAQQLFKKYSKVFDFGIKNTDYNILIKKVMAMIPSMRETTFTKTYFVGDQVMQETGPKCEFFTAHDSRRFFCIYALEHGMLPHQVMAITGHSSMSMLLDYLAMKKNSAEVMNKVFK